MVSLKPKLRVVESKVADRPARDRLKDKPGIRTQSGPEQTPQKEYVETLYSKYRRSLLSYLAQILPGGIQDANEILQETYVRLLRQDNLDHLEQNARAYIFTIATNLARDALRRRVSRMQDFHVQLDELNYASEEPSPFQVSNWEESVQKLKRALFKLTPLSRRIFLLSRFEQMTYTEISNMLHISTRTVERHMSTAIKELQIALEELL